MSPLPFLTPVEGLPPPYDRERVTRGLEDLARAAGQAGDGVVEAVDAVAADPAGADLLAALFGNSPFLGRVLLREVAYLPTLLSQSADAGLQVLLAETAAAELADAPMTALRQARRRLALLVACADLAGLWPLDQVTEALTRFADAAVQAAVRHLLREAAAKGGFAPADPDAPERASGLIVLAMGKYGAGELNYSSDIDLVILFDQEVAPLAQAEQPQRFFVRLTQGLVKLLQEQTADGYVFRVDLRLRPDPGATPPAISVTAAEHYYESMGQNWERAAMIKARAAAGDLDRGEAFLAELEPFIWRRNLDFASIEDVHSIKRQIHSHKGHGRIAVAGHNIKLGRGGIRDIEFFVQTQQLIAGGRDRDLRTPTTCGGLSALARAGWIGTGVAAQMTDAYRFHRTVEHRLQMIADEQTHVLPKSDAGIDHVARFMGFDDTGTFREALLSHLSAVQRHYAALFETAPALSEESGNLVFTGTEDDPDTLETLRRLGFAQPTSVSGTIRGWHHGRYRATRSTRARELLTDLMPALLKALAKTANPDAAFSRFDRFINGLPAGVQLFSLLYSNPGLLDLLAEICGTAPRLADYLSQNAGVLDAVLSEDFFDPLPPADELARSLAGGLRVARDFQDVLDVTRRFAKERRFQLGVQILSNARDAEICGPAYADLADTAIAGLLPYVEAEFARDHGRVPGGAMVVVAMGKLGGREMTATSDLDLLFLYDYPDEAAGSDGRRPLAPPHYFTRLSQRLINALTAPTGEGRLYDVDMRLRPSGSAGPVASRLGGFIEYQEKNAWTWEQMALTRARVVAGPEPLADRVREAVASALRRSREAAATAREVADMRARIDREKGSADPWEMKGVRGGLIDIEFVCQYLQLVHAAAHPGVLDCNTAAALGKLGEAGLLPRAVADGLLDSLRLIQRLTGLVRVAIEGPFDPEAAPQGLKQALARAGGVDDFADVERRLVEAEASALRVYEQTVEAAAT